MVTNLQVINASAGSGKTTLLINKFLYLILQSNKPNVFKSILAITFTNKAALEMKERLIESLTHISDGNFHNDEVLVELKEKLQLTDLVFIERAKNALAAILHNYADLAISTIDAFVYRLIKTFSKDLNLPSNFEVNLKTEDVLRECVDLVIESASSSKKIAEYLSDYIKNNLEDEKSWKIENQLTTFAQILLNNESKFELKELTKISYENITLKEKKCKEITQIYEATLKVKGLALFDLFLANNLDQDELAGGKNGIFGRVKKLTLGEKPNFNTLVKDLQKGKFYAAKADANTKSLIESITPQIEEKLKQILDFYDSENKNFTIASLLLKNIYQTGLLGELQKKLLNQKREKNFLLISDFNTLVSDALAEEDAPFIYLRTGEKFKHIFIDEFQDTSVTQWSNMLPLVENSLSDGNSVFLVGDVKQSIYRWRGSESEQLANFPNKPKSQRSATNNSGYEALKNYFNGLEILDTNYRSVENIVSFNNQLFEILSKNIDPNFKSFFEGFIQKPSKKGKNGYVEFNILPSENNNDIQLEALSKVIKRKIELNNQPKNILVLARGNEKIANITAYLTKQNIPVISSEGLLLKNSSKICLLIALVRYYYQRGINPELNATLWYWLQKNGIECQFELSDLESNHLTKVFPDKNLDELENLSVLNQFETFAYWINFYEKSDAFVVAFFNTISEYFTKFPDGFNGFNQWWEDQKDKLAIETPGDVNAVSVMTIHKAKGLQYDVVLLPFFNFRTFVIDYKNWVTIDQEKFGISTPYLPISSSNAESLNHKEEYTSEEQKTFLDALNLLYVALTRPKKELFLFTKDSKRDGASSAFINNLLNHAIPEIYGMAETTPDHWAWGEEFKYEEVKQPESEITMSLNYTPWQQKIKISTTKAKFKNRAMSEGERFHEIMAEIKSESSLKFVSEKFNLSENEVSKVNWILNHKEINQAFHPNAEIISENPILMPNGNKYIPDRVSLINKEVYLIDYKTGDFQKKYETQLKRYAEILASMGYENIKKQLVFTELEKIQTLN